MEYFQSIPGMPKKSIVPIYPDQNGSIWIGGNGEGLLHLEDNLVSHFGEKV